MKRRSEKQVPRTLKKRKFKKEHLGVVYSLRAWMTIINHRRRVYKKKKRIMQMLINHTLQQHPGALALTPLHRSSRRYEIYLITID